MKKTKEKKLVFVLTLKKEDKGCTETTYDFIGDEELKEVMEIYFLEMILNKKRYEKQNN